MGVYLGLILENLFLVDPPQCLFDMIGNGGILGQLHQGFAPKPFLRLRQPNAGFILIAEHMVCQQG